MHVTASCHPSAARPSEPPSTGPTDPLTGLATRDGLKRHLSGLRRQRGGLDRCALLYVRVRGLTSLMDDLGQPGVDLGIARCAAVIVEAVRGGDLVGRLGAQEFVVSCQGRDADLASLSIAPRIKLALSRLDLPLDVTVGMAFADPGDEPEDLLARTEQAMAATALDFTVC